MNIKRIQNSEENFWKRFFEIAKLWKITIFHKSKQMLQKGQFAEMQNLIIILPYQKYFVSSQKTHKVK